MISKVTYSGRVNDSLREAALRARAAGRVEEVQRAAHILYGWLRADSETLGEPFQNHKSRELTEYIGFVGPLIVRYNIRHATKDVFVLYPVRVARWAGL
jgi:hypothetical protein